LRPFRVTLIGRKVLKTLNNRICLENYFLPGDLEPRSAGRLLGQCGHRKLFGSLKVERLHGMRFGTRCQAKHEVMDWIACYNHRRHHSTLGYASSMA
jgi:hypothetical protein